MLHTIGKLSALGCQKSSQFLRRVTWRNAMGHNKMNTLRVIWAVTSEQNSFFCVLGVTHSCDLRHNQLSKWKFSALLQCAQFLRIFQKIVNSKVVWVVAIMVRGQFKTKKPYLWQIQLDWFFYKDHAVTFLKLKFIVFLMKKSQTLASKLSEHIVGGISWNTWKIDLRFHTIFNSFFCNPKTANYWKRSKKGFPSKHPCKYIVT